MTKTSKPTPNHAIELRRLDALNPDPTNPKAHDVDIIDGSISRFGVIDTIVVDGRTGFIVSGHGRTKTLTAMAQRGDAPPAGVQVDADGEWLVPVTTGWSSANDLEAQAAVIALNQTTTAGGWVDDALLDALEALSAADDGLVGVGFGEPDIEALRLLLGRVEDHDPTRDLDALEEEFGTATDADALRRVVLNLPPELAGRLEAVLSTVTDHQTLVAGWLDAGN